MRVEAAIAAALARHWGKAAPEVSSSKATHHTVLGHSLDVAACAFVLLERHPILRERIAAAGSLSAHRLPATIAAMCGLHDVGKIDVRFARKAPAIADELRPNTAGVPTGPYDHGTEGFRQLEQDDDAHEQLRELIGIAAIPLLRAVTGHHGILPTFDAPDPGRSLLPRALVREDVAARRRIG